jgi:beta-galactosidase
MSKPARRNARLHTKYLSCGKVACEDESSSSKAVCKVNSFSAWDCQSPLLYTAVIELKDESGRHADTVNQRFGIRHVSFDYEKGMTLNGRRFVMNGVCMHHDLGPLGAAFSIPAARRQLEILRSVGVNSIRTSHNPPAPELLDLCDEMGFLSLTRLSTAGRWARSKMTIMCISMNGRT